MAARAGLADLSIDDLRTRRHAARRTAEYAHLRARQGDGPTPDQLTEADRQVRELTDELIARYAADLSLVDSLLDAPYPAGGAQQGRARR